MKTLSILAPCRLAGSRFMLSQKLAPTPSWRITRLFLTSSVAKPARISLSALASPRHSECHWPPPYGGPSHQAIRLSVLKIAAAPLGQPGSARRLLPSPPVIDASALGEDNDVIAAMSSSKVTVGENLWARFFKKFGMAGISAGRKGFAGPILANDRRDAFLGTGRERVLPIYVKHAAERNKRRSDAERRNEGVQSWWSRYRNREVNSGVFLIRRHE